MMLSENCLSDSTTVKAESNGKILKNKRTTIESGNSDGLMLEMVVTSMDPMTLTLCASGSMPDTLVRVSSFVQETNRLRAGLV